jgi:hypothetical protein
MPAIWRYIQFKSIAKLADKMVAVPLSDSGEKGFAATSSKLFRG